MRIVFKVNYYKSLTNITFEILDEDDNRILIYRYWECSDSVIISLPRMEKWI